jgi:hypothetical protein
MKLAEAPSFGQSIIDDAPTRSGAVDYLAMSQEVIAMEEAMEVAITGNAQPSKPAVARAA